MDGIMQNNFDEIMSKLEEINDKLDKLIKEKEEE